MSSQVCLVSRLVNISSGMNIGSVIINISSVIIKFGSVIVYIGSVIVKNQ